jgi:hypothetical protein
MQNIFYDPLCRILLLFCCLPLSTFSQVKDSIPSSPQSANQDYIEIYKENGDFSYTSPKGEIGAPSKYILMGKLTNTYMLLGTKNSRIAFAVIPDFTVRVRDEFSAGVRTPSYRLGAALYTRIGTSTENYKYAELGFTHHSNGQDENAINPDGSINTRTGNFSTNYLTTSYRFGYEHPFNRHPSGTYSVNQRVGLEWHKWFAYEKALENDYGFTRLLYNLSWRDYTTYVSKKGKHSWKKISLANDASPSDQKLEKESIRLNLEVSYAVNKMAAYEITSIQKRLNIELALHGSLPFMNRAMFMVSGGYYGEDPYNIYYRDKYGFVRFGISTGFMRYRVSKL